MSWFARDRGWVTWDIHPGLDAGYHVAVAPGPVLDWTEGWLRALELALDRLPQRMVLKAAPVSIFPARKLGCGTTSGPFACHAISSQVFPLLDSAAIPGMKPPCAHRDRDLVIYWIGLLAKWLDQPAALEKHLSVPHLDAFLLEEIAHVWDYRLEARNSEFSSNLVTGKRWAELGVDPTTGHRRRIQVPNRKRIPKPDPELESVEDWASMVVWYVLRPDAFQKHDPAHFEFARDLFATHGM